MHIWHLLARAHALYPDALAIVDGDRRCSYAQVFHRAAALAAFLRAQGFAAGDRIAVLGCNSLEYLELYFAVAGAGLVIVPLNYRLAPPEIGAILAAAEVKLVFADQHLTGNLTDPRPDTVWFGAGGPYERIACQPPARFVPGSSPADAVAQIYYTSGTTGRAKGVMLTHANVCTHALAAIAELGLTDRDVWGHFAPMFHLADAWATFAITWVGGRHVMVPRFEPAAVLTAIESERVTITNLVPTMLTALLARDDLRARDFTSLRLLLSGGAPIAPEVVRRLVTVFGVEYVQTYGMTETSPYLTLSTLKAHLRNLPEHHRLAYQAKTGRPFLTVELEVVDEQGRPVRADQQQVGEIRVRGPTVTPGYWNDPDATAAAFDADGFLRTGDLAVIDSEGYVAIVDRKKDMILTGGENVYSVEVENVLYRHPAVLEAAVFGVPDPQYGESVRAAVVLRAGHQASAEQLVAFCRQSLGGYKVPRTVVFLAELPRTGSGKISKRLLRERGS